MKILEHLPKLLVVAVVGGGLAVGAMRLFDTGSTSEKGGFVLPELSVMGTSGKVAFDKNCAQCHGVNGLGSDKGPPLIHPIYNPGHHSDRAFVMAAGQGVRQHHWRFGDMPAQPQVGPEDIAAIIAYVREIQTANGIVYEPHRM